MVEKLGWWTNREWHTKWTSFWKGNLKMYYELVLARHSGYNNVPLDQIMFDLYIKDETSTPYPIGSFSLSDLIKFRDGLDRLIKQAKEDEINAHPTEKFVKEV